LSLVFSKQVFKFGFFVQQVFFSSAKFQVGFVESLKSASRFLACVSVCGGFDWRRFAASALFVVGFVGFQNWLVCSWKKFWQKYKSLFFSKHSGQHKVSSFRQSLQFGVLIGESSFFQQSFWFA